LQALGVTVWSLTQGAAGGPDIDADPSLRNPVGVFPEPWGQAVTGWDLWLLQYPLLLAVPAIGVRLVRQRPDDQRHRLVSVLAAVVVYVLLTVVGRWLLPPA